MHSPCELNNDSHSCTDWAPGWLVRLARVKDSAECKFKKKKLLWFQLVTWGGQEQTFDSRICAWANRLTHEMINNTLPDLMRHWFSLRSIPLMPTLMWRHRWNHPQSKHIGGSLAGAPCSPLSCRDEAEIFSIKSTWSQCHRFPLQFSSWLAASVHTHRRSRLHINACVCSTSFHQQLWWNLYRHRETQLFELAEFVIHLLIKHKCSTTSGSAAARCRLARNPEKAHQKPGKSLTATRDWKTNAGLRRWKSKWRLALISLIWIFLFNISLFRDWINLYVEIDTDMLHCIRLCHEQHYSKKRCG